MARKVFDDSKGKHVDKQVTLPVDEIFEQPEYVKRALGVKCPDCNARPDEKCFSIVDASKVYEPAHWRRIEAVRGKTDAP